MALFRKSSVEKGQGLVEYALILVLVAIVVIAVLLLVGPAVSGVFARVTAALNPTAITGVSGDRTGGGNGNSVEVTITTSLSIDVTVSDTQNATDQTTLCNRSCTVTMSGVGPDAGSLTIISSDGGWASLSYPPKN